MASATVPQRVDITKLPCLLPAAPRPIAHGTLRKALRRLGISQNELARRIGKNPGLVSRVLQRKMASADVWRRIHAFLADPIHYRPPEAAASLELKLPLAAPDGTAHTEPLT